MSQYQFHEPSLLVHEPQVTRFNFSLRRPGSLQLNRGGFDLLLSNFKNWFIDTWFDWLTLIIIGATAAGVSLLPSPN